MSSMPEYLNMKIFLEVCTPHEQNIIATWFRKFFQHKQINIKQPLNNDGLRLFIMLGLYYPVTGQVRCMACHKDGKRCKNQLDIGKLGHSMQRLWDIARAHELQGQDLLEEIYHLCLHFLCESRHRREVNGRVAVAEEMAMSWYSVFQEFRHGLPMGQAQPAASWVKGEETGSDEMDTSW